MRSIASILLAAVGLSLATTASAQNSSATPAATTTDAPATPAPAASPEPAATAEAAAVPTATAAPKSFDAMSLEELLDVPIAVASKKATTVREAPGVVTLVTREEILASGARDLIDVLRLVPGFDFGVDVGGVVGIGFRGNWGHEGKVLLLVDGVMRNEVLYSTTYYGNEFPVDEIDHVEIIRGPGSSVYGGYAELAVVNVITRTADALARGGDVYGRVSASSAGFSQTATGFAIGGQYADGVEVTAVGFAANGRRGDGLFVDDAGSSFPMSRQRLDPHFLDLGAAWQDVHLRVLLNDYFMTAQDGYDVATARPYAQRFTDASADLLWNAHPTSSLTITPRFTFLHQLPWRTTDADPNGTYYDKTAERLTGGLAVSWDALESLNLLLGGEAYHENAWLNGPLGVGFETPLDANGDLSVHYDNVAGYGQLSWRGPVDVAVGARYENHSKFGSSFVPRAALTKVFGRFHVKALYADAFRAPGIENVAINPDIEPERTRVFEGEVGARIGDNVIVTANAFDVTIKKTIVYAVLGSNTEGYFNQGESGTTGGELDVHVKFAGGFVDANGSYATPNGKNKVATYAVPGHDDYTLAWAHWKAALNSSFTVLPHVSIAPSAIVLGERYYMDPTETPKQRGVDALVNLMINTHELVAKNVDLSVGVYDLLDRRPPFIEPYDGGHAPLPWTGRSMIGRATVSF